ncbi:hypothetical protein [Mesorhizobium sp. M0676]|uniref:hypothetical protein n=1 Tax=Mesorhizobium sp. M0676 TaxID=2956984 RepID=UPI00333DE817
MVTYRTHSIEFKRQVVQEFLSGETLHGLAKRHELPRCLIRICSEIRGRLLRRKHGGGRHDADL